MPSFLEKISNFFVFNKKINVVQPNSDIITGIGLSSGGFVAPLKKLNLLGECIEYKEFIRHKNIFKKQINLLVNLPPWGGFDRDLFPSIVSCYVSESNKMAPRQAEFLAPCKAIWAPTKFCNAVLERHGLKSVIVPYSIEKPTRERIKEGKSSFTFLVSFDGKFSYVKKGIIETIEAFKLAFNSKAENVLLKIKTFDLKPETREVILKSIAGDLRIALFEARLENFEELYDGVSCYVSLHKGEGFGRHIAESMLRELPTVVSCYGGPLDYVNDSNSVLVKQGTMSRHDWVCSQYSWDGEWFDVNIEAAAAALQKIYNTKEIEIEKMKKLAKTSVTEKYSVDAVAEKIRQLWSII